MATQQDVNKPFTAMMAPTNSTANNERGKGVKKPFNKKKWREQQYSHKEKVSDWQARRKMAIERDYKKMLKREGIQTQPANNTSEPQLTLEQANPASSSSTNRNDTRPERPGRLTAYQRAKLEFEKKQEEKKQRLEALAIRKAEKEDAIKKYKQRKLERFKKISQKTRKGQPVMKGRIELLLEKIQKQVNS